MSYLRVNPLRTSAQAHDAVGNARDPGDLSEAKAFFFEDTDSLITFMFDWHAGIIPFMQLTVPVPLS